MIKKYKRVVDNRMRWQGDTDLEKKVIRVNKVKSKRKSSIIDTMVHEEMHAKHPQMYERTVATKTKGRVRTMGPQAKARLRSKYR